MRLSETLVEDGVEKENRAVTAFNLTVILGTPVHKLAVPDSFESQVHTVPCSVHLG